MASPFASMTTSDPIPLPFDEGQWVKVRQLTGRQYEQTQVAHRETFMNGTRWAGVFRESIANGLSSEAVKKAIADPLTGHDRYELVRLGLAEWSYSQSLKPATVKSTVEGEPDRVIDAIEDLNDDAIEFIAREVLRRAKPMLFVETVDEAEADQKKG